MRERKEEQVLRGLMETNGGRGEIPSYKSMATREASKEHMRTRTKLNNGENSAYGVN